MDMEFALTVEQKKQFSGGGPGSGRRPLGMAEQKQLDDTHKAMATTARESGFGKILHYNTDNYREVQHSNGDRLKIKGDAWEHRSKDGADRNSGSGHASLQKFVSSRYGS